MPALSTRPDEPSADQQMYWQEFLQLKTNALYIRNYRNSVGSWVTVTATVRAIASSGSIAAWVVFRDHARIWASIIALSQLADALRNVFPFARRRKVLSAWTRALDRLFILAQRDWEDIAAGRSDDLKTRKLLHQLRLNQQKLEHRFAPDGLDRKEALVLAAEAETVRYSEARYNTEEVQGVGDGESSERKGQLGPG